jgi:FkbM family methyltransferase
MKIFGYKVFKKKEIDDIFFNKFKSLQYFFDKKDRLTIFDIGANIGQSVDSYTKNFPNSLIHSFEPDNEAYCILSSKQKSNVIYNNFALGANNETKKLYKYLDSSNNSFYQLNNNSFAITSGAHPNVLKCTNQIKQDIQESLIVTIDEYINKNNLNKVNIMKIDVQGFENEVLKGSCKSLKDNIIDLIVVEIIFDDIYGKRNSFYEVEKIISQFGYKLWDISHIYKDLRANKTSWVDVIYAHETLIDKYYKNN